MATYGVRLSAAAGSIRPGREQHRPGCPGGVTTQCDRALGEDHCEYSYSSPTAYDVLPALPAPAMIMRESGALLRADAAFAASGALGAGLASCARAACERVLARVVALAEQSGPRTVLLVHEAALTARYWSAGGRELLVALREAARHAVGAPAPYAPAPSWRSATRNRCLRPHCCFTGPGAGCSPSSRRPNPATWWTSNSWFRVCGRTESGRACGGSGGVTSAPSASAPNPSSATWSSGDTRTGTAGCPSSVPRPNAATATGAS
jgi:hypothetical protein